jgi:hypothetical protein
MRRPQNLKKSPTCFDKAAVLTKQLFLLSSIKTNGRFFQFFVVFSGKLNFTAKFLIFSDSAVEQYECCISN